MEADYIRGNASLIYQSRDHNLTTAITRIKEAINTVKAKAGMMSDTGGLPILLADKQVPSTLRASSKKETALYFLSIHMGFELFYFIE